MHYDDHELDQLRFKLIAKLANCPLEHGLRHIADLVDLPDAQFTRQFDNLLHRWRLPLEDDEPRETMFDMDELIDFSEHKLGFYIPYATIQGSARTVERTRLTSIIADVYQHADQQQVGQDRRPTGYDILRELVPSQVAHIIPGKIRVIQPRDGELINYFRGQKILLWIQEHWLRLPEDFKVWTEGKRLHGFRDMKTTDNKRLVQHVPFLDCRKLKDESDIPAIKSKELEQRWGPGDFLLR